MAGNLTPRYAWWVGTNISYALYDAAAVDPLTGRIPTSRPLGRVGQSEAKLYPFKYKTATQPLANYTNQLIALDTSVYFKTGEPIAAIQAGLENMGYQPTESYSWVETDTFQLITHGVAPSANALNCSACHGSTARMDLKGELGYQLNAAVISNCFLRQD